MKQRLLLFMSLLIGAGIATTLLATVTPVSATHLSVSSNSPSQNEEFSATIPLTNSEPFELLGQLGGLIDHVAVSGTYAYVNINNQLAVLDVKTPSAITLVDQSIKLDAEITDIDIYHGYLFVSATDGLHIYDLSKPGKPHALSVYPQLIYRTDFLGDYAYSLYIDTMTILDISNPSTPTLASSVSIPSGKCCYIGEADTSPRWSLSPQRLVSAQTIFTYGNPHIMSDTTRIYSMADPIHPTQIAERPDLDEFKLPDFLLTKGTRYFTGDTHLVVYETADPNHVNTLATAPLGIPGYAEWVDTRFATEQNGYLYLSGRQYNTNHQIDTVFHIVDISNPAAPVARGGFATAYPIKDMEVAGNYVYATDGDLHIIDIHNPQAPVLVGTYADAGKYFNESSFMVAQGGFVYLAGKEFLVVDARNPASPEVVGRYSPLGTATSLAISGTRAYLNLVNREGERWLRILDISDPTNPTRLGYLLPHGAWASQVVGERLYTFVSYESHLIFNILDVSQPLTPSVVATVTIPNTTSGFAVIGNYAYFARDHDSRAILDLTKLEFTSSQFDEASEIQQSGNRLYIESLYNGWLGVYEVNNQSQLERTATYCSGAKLWTANGDHIFTTNKEWLEVYDLRQPSNPFPVAYKSFADNYDAIAASNGLFIVRKAQSLYFLKVHDERFAAGIPVQSIWVKPKLTYNGLQDNRTSVNYPVSFWTIIFPVATYPLTVTIQGEGLPPQVEVHNQPDLTDGICSRSDSIEFAPISFPTPGTKVVSFTAENIAGTTIATTTLEIMGYPPVTITPSSGATLRYCDLIDYPSDSMNFCPSVLDFPAGLVTQTTQIQMTPYYDLSPYPFDNSQLHEEDAQWIAPASGAIFTIEVIRSQALSSEITFSQPFSVSQIVMAYNPLSQDYDMTQFHLRRWNGERWERAANVSSIEETYLDKIWYALTFPVRQTGLYLLFGERAHERSLFLPLITNN